MTTSNLASPVRVEPAQREFLEQVAALAPIFVALPGGTEFIRPARWPQTPLRSLDEVLADWRPDYALCAALGDALAVVDVDPRNEGDVDRVREMLAAHSVQVFAEVTTPGNGVHFYVAADPDLRSVNSPPGWPGVDLLGTGHHVFLPGTQRPHYQGRGYTVVSDNLAALVDDGDPDGAAALAGWVAGLTERAGRERATTGTVNVASRTDASAYVQRALNNELGTLASTPEGGRNRQLNESAFNLAQLVGGGYLDRQHVWDMLRDTALRIGLPEKETEDTLASAFKAGEAQPRQVPDRAPPLTLLPSIEGEEPAEEVDLTAHLTPGGNFILDIPLDAEPLWGRGSEVLMEDGEALILAGDQGLGKTTLAQQLALGRCGFPEYADLLGYPITPGQRRTLYLAMDRPKQAARSFRRMVGEAWRKELNDRLVVWQGPPPHDLAKHRRLLLDLCQAADADTVVVDSLKDAAVGLTDDEVAAGYNLARQAALHGGVQVVELHHNRKRTQGGKSELTIHDLYGSVWLTSGVGSVLLLAGAPGDSIVRMFHVKQPSDTVGPLQVQHDHLNGRSEVFHAVDLVALARQRPISALDAAKVLHDTEKPDANQKAKARRALERLQRTGHLRLSQEGDPASNTPSMWAAR